MESVFPWKVRILDTRNTHYQPAGYWLSCSRGRQQRRPLIGQNVTSLAGPGLLLAARDVERIASGCAAGSSTAPPCASLPALDTFRPSRREHRDWSLEILKVACQLGNSSDLLVSSDFSCWIKIRETLIDIFSLVR